MRFVLIWLCSFSVYADDLTDAVNEYIESANFIAADWTDPKAMLEFTVNDAPYLQAPSGTGGYETIKFGVQLIDEGRVVDSMPLGVLLKEQVVESINVRNLMSKESFLAYRLAGPEGSAWELMQGNLNFASDKFKSLDAQIESHAKNLTEGTAGLRGLELYQEITKRLAQFSNKTLLVDSFSSERFQEGNVRDVFELKAKGSSVAFTMDIFVPGSAKEKAGRSYAMSLLRWIIMFHPAGAAELGLKSHPLFNEALAACNQIELAGLISRSRRN